MSVLGTYFDKAAGAPEPGDEFLVTQARQGDRWAFEKLVKRYERPLYNYLRRMTGDPTDAEDVFQETFLKVYSHLNRFQEGRPFKPWLYRIATNTARDFLRHKRRRPQVSLDDEDGARPSLLDTLAASLPSPSSLLASRENVERLEKAVAGLSEIHRAVFLLSRYEGLPYSEIAEVLDIPVGTVKSRMNKAVHELLDALKETP
ncbi:MAG: RNA polymerase sigma factor [Candidatus Hydrogenedentota bacterium]